MSAQYSGILRAGRRLLLLLLPIFSPPVVDSPQSSDLFFSTWSSAHLIDVLSFRAKLFGLQRAVCGGESWEGTEQSVSIEPAIVPMCYPLLFNFPISFFSSARGRGEGRGEELQSSRFNGRSSFMLLLPEHSFASFVIFFQALLGNGGGEGGEEVAG